MLPSDVCNSNIYKCSKVKYLKIARRIFPWILCRHMKEKRTHKIGHTLSTFTAHHANVRVIAVLIACLKALMTFITRCDHPELFLVVCTLTFTSIRMIQKISLQIFYEREEKSLPDISLKLVLAVCSGFTFPLASFSAPFCLVQQDCVLLSFEI